MWSFACGDGQQGSSTNSKWSVSAVCLCGCATCAVRVRICPYEAELMQQMQLMQMMQLVTQRKADVPEWCEADQMNLSSDCLFLFSPSHLMVDELLFLVLFDKVASSLP